LLLWGSVCHHVEREASRFHHIYPLSSLDAILARILSQVIGTLSDAELSAIVTLAITDFTTGRPWSFGEWR
jgi:hypothetical protein